MSKSSTICLVAGRSGGHLIPALTLAQQFIEQDAAVRIFMISTNTQLDYKIIQKYSFVQNHLALKFDTIKKSPWGFIHFILQGIQASVMSLYYLRKHRPAKIIGTGGYVCIPVCLAAWLLRIPIELFELNAVPGKAMHLLMPLATKVNYCFTATRFRIPIKKAQFVSYPIRFKLLNTINSAKQARLNCGLDEHKKTILMLGGSQGSIFINQQIKQLIEDAHLQFSTCQFIHQTGTIDTFDWKSWYARHAIDAIIFDYYHAMEHYYQAADLIICRAGAGTLFEIHFFNKPCIIIPLEISSNTHQVDNAYAFLAQYGDKAKVIRQGELTTSAVLYDAIKQMLH